MSDDLRTRIADEISGIQVGSGYESTTIGITAALEAADALIAAGVVAEEPEWAVSVARTTGYGDPVVYDFPDRLAAERFIKNPPLWFPGDDNQTKTLVRRRKAGPWAPVKQEGADDVR